MTLYLMGFNNNALKFHKSLDSDLRHLVYHFSHDTTIYSIYYFGSYSITQIMLAKNFSLIISNDESMTNFLISKNVLVNNKKTNFVQM